MGIKLYTCLWLLLMGQFAMAQESVITGKVTDGQTEEPLPGVNIRVKGTTQGAITDLDGNFRLNASPGDVLVFSFVGFLSEEVTLGNQTQLQVRLSPDLKTLNEVVVVGYGTQKKKKLQVQYLPLMLSKLPKPLLRVLSRAYREG